MEEIYKKYSKLVYKYLYTLTRDIELSEELTQETFYSAIKNLKNFRNECKISVWLCQIAKHKWIDYLSNNKKTIPFDEHIIDQNLFFDECEKIIEKNDLYEKINKLDKDTKNVFYLRLKSELTFKEIGEILGKSEEWARITFYRGKIKLEKGLKNYEL